MYIIILLNEWGIKSVLNALEMLSKKPAPNTNQDKTILAFFLFLRKPFLPLLPFTPKRECYLDRNEDDNNPLKMNTVLFAQSLSHDACNLLSIIHLFIQSFDSNADIESPADLIIVALEAQLMSTVPEEVR